MTDTMNSAHVLKRCRRKERYEFQEGPQTLDADLRRAIGGGGGLLYFRWEAQVSFEGNNVTLSRCGATWFQMSLPVVGISVYLCCYLAICCCYLLCEFLLTCVDTYLVISCVSYYCLPVMLPVYLVRSLLFTCCYLLFTLLFTWSVTFPLPVVSPGYLLCYLYLPNLLPLAYLLC